MTLLGVDLASFQGRPGQWKSAAGDITWAGVKLTELSAAGSYINPFAADDWAWLKAHGKIRVGYLFAHPGESALGTAHLFSDTITRLGLDDGDGIAVDLEVTNGQRPGQVAEWTRQVLTVLQRDLRRTPLLYTYISFAQSGNCLGLRHYPLWISDPSSHAGRPRVPLPWTGWAIHQFTITGAVDRDVATWPTPAAMRAAIGVTRPGPKPKPSQLAEAPMMLLAKGAGKLTPVAIPMGAKALRFVADQSAQLEVTFHGGHPQSLMLTWRQGSEVLSVPGEHHAALVTRVDAGPGDVCVTAE